MAKRTETAALPPAPEPNERDKAAIVRASARVLARPKRASVRLQGGDIRSALIAPPHSDEIGHARQMLDTFGTVSHDFMATAFGQLLDTLTGRDKAATESEINATLAIVAGAEPANEIEALLASQMAATHGLAMTLLGRTRRAEQLNQVEVQGGLAVKLLRTFTMQVETLAKLRRGGGQTVRVEHVHVHPGGQAIVGAVTTGGGSQLKSEEQPHAKPAALTHADAPFDPLRSTHPERERVPVARDA